MVEMMDILVPVLLAIVGFIGAMMVKQLMKIADSVQRIEKELGVLSNDHANLKEDHRELKDRISALEYKQ